MKPRRKRFLLFLQHKNLTFLCEKRPATGWETNNSHSEYIKNNSLEKWTKDINRHFTENEMKMTNNHIF